MARGKKFVIDREELEIANKTMSNKELVAHFKVGLCTLFRIKKEYGISKEIVYTNTIQDQARFIIDRKTMTNNQLAAKYGVNKKSVQKTARLLGLPAKDRVIPDHKFSIDDKDKFIELYATMSNKELAKYYGVVVDTITRTAQRFGLGGRGKSGITEIEQYKKDLFLMSRVELCKKWNISLNTMRQFNREIGIAKPIVRKRKENPVTEGTIMEIERYGKKAMYIRIGWKWKYLPVYNWLQAGKEIPNGYSVQLISDDYKDCSVENIHLVTRYAVEKSSKPVRTDTRKEYYNNQRKLRQERTELKAQEVLKKKEAAMLLAQKREQAKKDKLAAKEDRIAKRKLKFKEMREATAEKNRLAKEQRRFERQQKKTNKEAVVRRDKEVKKKELNVRKSWEQQSKKNANRTNSRALKTKAVDYSQKRLIRVDAKTSIYIGINEDPSAAIAKYHKMKDERLKLTA